MFISNRAKAIKASSTLEIDALYKKMLSNGKNVISFGVGEPDFNTPNHIKNSAILAINNNKTKYTAASGMPDLKNAICNRLKKDLNIEYSPEQVVVTSGAKHSIYIALMCILNDNDEVIIPAPYWLSYTEMISMTGAKSIVLNTSEQNNFKITAQILENAITPKTKLLILNSPSNPTGMIYTKQELQLIAQTCIKHNILILSDEIYYKLVYDNINFVSMASINKEIKDLCIIINGVSKTYAMTGWRIGYALAPLNIAKAMSNYVSHSTSAPCTISQYAALEALISEQDFIEEMRLEFQKRRDILCTRINSISYISCNIPSGAFYVMLNISKLISKEFMGISINNDDELSKLLLEHALVATVPCSDFGVENFLRLSYATSIENINTGMDRIESFISKLDDIKSEHKIRA